MRIAMVFPSRESEKAISGYSHTLAESMRKNVIDADDFTYLAGKPISLLRKVHQLSKYDIIHVQHEYNLLGWYGLPFFLFYFLLSLRKGTVVTTMHTILSQKEKFREGKIKTFLRKALYQIQNRFIGFFSKKIVVHTDFLKKILYFEYGIKRSKISVFPQGIIEGIPKYEKSKIKKELKLSGKIYLLTGSMIPDHGHDIVLKQADKIGSTILVVANPGSVNDRNSRRTRAYLKENEKIVEQKSFEKFVRFDVSEKITDKNPVWWKYFSAADLVLLPYRVGHGSGIFAHSMAAGRPVIATNVKFFSEIAKKFGCVKVAEKNNDFPKRIMEAMKPKNYKKMISECKRYFNENNLSVVAKKYGSLYLSLKK